VEGDDTVTDLGRVFNDVPRLYDRVRPGYPAELFADFAAGTGVGAGSPVLEVGCGTGQATRPLAALGAAVTAVEPGADLAALARERLAGQPRVAVETAAFEEWDDRGRRFDAVVAASSWHWVDPVVGWRRAHDVLRPGGWFALLAHVVVRRPGEPEMYAETADLHERFAPGDTGWGHPPTEAEAREQHGGWGPVTAPAGDLFGPPEVRWYPTVQWFDGAGLADHLRSTSLYRRLDPRVREPLLEAIADRIRTRLGDRAARRYLTVLRLAQRS
jgi:SAM-dependent methyltransferase